MYTQYLIIKGTTFGRRARTLRQLPCGFFLFTIFLHSIGIICAILNVYYNDFKHILNFSLQAAFFLTPIIYELKQIGTTFREIIKFNPLTQYIVSFQKVLTDEKILSGNEIPIIFSISIVSFFISFMFLKMAKNKISFYI